MSRNGKSRLQLNSASNRSSLRLPTWEEESQVAMSFAQLSPGSVDKFLVSIGYLFGFRVDYHTGPRKSLFQAASMKAGQRGYFQDLNEVETELSHTHSERETNYLHKGWLGSALSPISPWTQLRIDSNNQHNRAEAFTTKRIIAPRLHVEILQEDLVPAPGLEAAVKEALELSSQPERIQAIYRIFERWGDMIPLIFDVGISVTVTDRKSNYEANPINLSSHELWRLIEHSTARVSTQGVNLGALQNGLGAWMYECDVLVCQWSQVRVVKAIPVTAILDKELQLRLLEAHNLLISFDPLVLKGEPHSGFTRDDAPLAAKLIKSVTVWGSDQITSLHVTYRDGTVSAQQRSDKGSGNTFSLNDGEYICLVVVWRDSKGVCAIQFFTTYGLVSDCYGGGGGIPTIMGNNGGYLAALMDVMDRDTVYELQALWRHDVNCFKPSDTWKFSQYYGSGGGSRFDDLALINHSTSTYITSVKVRGGSYRTIDGIQLTYSHREGSTRVTLEGSYHGGSGAKEDTLVLTAKEYIVAVKGKVDDYIVQLGFVTNLGRTCTVSGHGDGQEFASEAPLGVDGKPMRLHSIFGRCESRLHGVLFVWATV